ncbi:hypothetical protein WA026_014967, partial [Henosepilachna vigintioctopunctata]
YTMLFTGKTINEEQKIIKSLKLGVRNICILSSVTTDESQELKIEEKCRIFRKKLKYRLSVQTKYKMSINK